MNRAIPNVHVVVRVRVGLLQREADYVLGSYAVSAPADRDASQLHCSIFLIKKT